MTYRTMLSCCVTVTIRNCNRLFQLVKMCLSDHRGRIRIGNNMSYSFEIRSGLKQGYRLSPLLFNFSLEYAILKIKDEKELTLNILNQLLLYADDVDLMGDDKYSIQSNAYVLLISRSFRRSFAKR